MILRSIGKKSAPILSALQARFGTEYFYCWNSFRHSTPWAIAAYSSLFSENKDILCAETPLIGRAMFDAGDSRTYYRIGKNLVSSFSEDSFNIPQNPTYSRIEDILSVTQTEIKPWRTNGEHIVYAMQVPEDSSLMGLDVFAAAQYDLMLLRSLTSRPIFVIQHPDVKHGWGKTQLTQNKRHYDSFLQVVDITKSTLHDGPASTFFNDAWCLVCHSSGTAFDAIAAGIPAITLSERSFVRPLSSTSWHNINSPLMPERMHWLAKIAYTQWTCAEVSNGDFVPV